MFKNAKVGDRVWSFSHHWGTIKEIILNNSITDYPLVVIFDDGIIERYNFDGKYNKLDIYPTLLWDEIKYEMPKKPFNLESAFRILEETEFDETNYDNYYIFYSKTSDKLDYASTSYRKYLGIKFFTKESILKFFKEIEFKKISEQEFFYAYNKVFGGID